MNRHSEDGLKNQNFRGSNSSSLLSLPEKKQEKNKTKKSGGEVYWMGHPEVVTTVDGFTNPFEK